MFKRHIVCADCVCSQVAGPADSRGGPGLRAPSLGGPHRPDCLLRLNHTSAGAACCSQQHLAAALTITQAIKGMCADYKCMIASLLLLVLRMCMISNAHTAQLHQGGVPSISETP